MIFSLKGGGQVAELEQKIYESANKQWGATMDKLEVETLNKNYIDNICQQAVCEVNIPRNLVLKGNVFVPLIVNKNRKEYANVKINLWKKVFISTHYVKSHQLLSSADIQEKTIEISKYSNEGYITNNTEIIGRESTMAIAPNFPFWKWMVQDIPVIRRNTSVEIRIVKGAVILKLQGTALEDGYMGEMIQVRKKYRVKQGIVKAKVIGPNKVLLERSI